jgi:hypothetical protein
MIEPFTLRMNAISATVPIAVRHWASVQIPQQSHTAVAVNFQMAAI